MPIYAAAQSADAVSQRESETDHYLLHVLLPSFAQLRVYYEGVGGEPPPPREYCGAGILITEQYILSEKCDGDLITAEFPFSHTVNQERFRVKRVEQSELYDYNVFKLEKPIPLAKLKPITISRSSTVIGQNVMGVHLGKNPDLSSPMRNLISNCVVSKDDFEGNFFLPTCTAKGSTKPLEADFIFLSGDNTLIGIRKRLDAYFSAVNDIMSSSALLQKLGISASH